MKGLCCALLLCCQLIVSLPCMAVPPDPMTVQAPVVAVDRVFGVRDTQERRYTGRLVAPATISLVPRVSGEILEVGFRDGDHVRAGQILYRIDAVRYEAAVKNAEGKVLQYAAEHTYARADLARNRSLFRKKAVSQDALDSAERAEKVARGELLAAQADLETARDDLRNTRIIAPISGRMGVTAQVAGNYVTSASGTLATLVQTDPIRVRFAVGMRDLLSVFGSEKELMRRGRVRIILADQTPYAQEGHVTIVDNAAESRTDTVLAYAELPNADGRLLPNSTVVVTLWRTADDDETTPAVPPSAVMHDAEGAFVYVVGEDQLARKRRVTLGNVTEEAQTILKGLALDELIITDGTHKVHDGMPVEYTPTTSRQHTEG